jgi:hypothetical protein
MTKKKVLTQRQKKAIKLLFDNVGMSVGEAMRQAGYSDASANNPGHCFTQSEGVKEVFRKIGIDEASIGEVIKDGFTATKPIGYLHSYKKSKDGQIEKCQPDECMSPDFVEVKDHTARLKSAELGSKILGFLNDKIDHTGEIVVSFKGGNQLLSEAEATIIPPEPKPS